MAGYLGYRPNYDIISDNSIDSDQYVDGSIDLAHMSVNSIDSDQYVDASIDLAHLAADSVDGTKIVDDAINSEHYAAASVDDAHLATGISASKLTGSLPALTLAGALTGADQIVTSIILKDYGEVTNAIGGTGGGTQDIDLTLGNSISATVDTSTNTFTFSNPTTSDELCTFMLILKNGGSQTVNWPASVDWAGASAPTLTTSGTDILMFATNDGGTIWHGVASSLDSS